MNLENKLFESYFRKEISRDELIFELDFQNPGFVVLFHDEIIKTEDAKDGMRLEFLIYALYLAKEKQELDLQHFVDDLNCLLLERWHKQHENIVALLQEIANEKSVRVLMDAIDLKLKYLSWDDNYSFEKKCVRAIYHIGKDKARPYLEKLCKHDNIQIRDLASKQLKKLAIPKEGTRENVIRAMYTSETIRVYQAFNSSIADEAVALGTFGSSFKMDRMTWIKTSFLWMMYRSGWATKTNQERILAIDMKRDGFDYLVKNSVLSSYQESIYGCEANWQNKIRNSDIRCQWDPERDISGNPLDYRAIQIGISGKSLEKYVHQWIVSITDITGYVSELRKKVEEGKDISDDLPVEKDYIIQ